MEETEGQTEFDFSQSTDASSDDSGRKLSLRDIRRYDKKTLMCPGGCGLELELTNIPNHECVRDLRQKLESIEGSLREEANKMTEARETEALYKEQLWEQESKIEQMSTEIKELLSERSRRDEIFNNKETFYKEQLSALREQVTKLERKLQLRRPSNQDEDAFDGANSDRAWAFRYDRLLAEKITLETLFQRKAREYEREVEALKEEAAMLRESLHLERDMLSLEHDHATYRKLECLTDQLESLIQHKNQKREQRKQHKGKELMDDESMNGVIRKRVPNSIGSSTSECDEDDMEDSCN